LLRLAPQAARVLGRRVLGRRMLGRRMLGHINSRINRALGDGHENVLT
jgi:hypothetical protein